MEIGKKKKKKKVKNASPSWDTQKKAIQIKKPLNLNIYVCHVHMHASCFSLPISIYRNLPSETPSPHTHATLVKEGQEPVLIPDKG
ncbi:hypothetical protein I7I52_07971 [Histoplasma capsulatum]|uniref:Uncharacterized protein n=1 Tax=Ajellomyces capsulatus TaxID=5037 RepID=A0A8H7YJS4_AJECA|nr:hypothetical protein I7I52_07971 [Histoplasma capsulatum]